ncbi:MAG TPA: TetR/AcrR family transcriptional regulator [Candidatus Binatia bacterium]|jgi:AcrR family transcriptional regulator|nr:TetR/AcrR family transcriptional regulator [Candidatus Binatia bacterium]
MAKTALEKAREAPGSTKARILEAAEEVFAARGFQGASTREIAARAGVNISSLHYHWESKETLYVAVFRNIYEQLIAQLREALAPLLEHATKGDRMIDHAMDVLFEFFAGNPNIPKLLVRRLVENDEIDAGIDRDILVPAWDVFSGWLKTFGRRTFSDEESRLFMLTAHSAVLVYLLDSRPYQNLLGGSVLAPGGLRERVRAHVTELVHKLLGP